MGAINIKASDLILGSTTTSFGGKSKQGMTSEVSKTDFFSIEKDNFAPTPFQQHKVTHPVHTELPAEPPKTSANEYRIRAADLPRFRSPFRHDSPE